MATVTISPPEAISKNNFLQSIYLIHLFRNTAGTLPIVQLNVKFIELLKCHALPVWHFAFLSLTNIAQDLIKISTLILTAQYWRGFQRMISFCRELISRPAMERPFVAKNNCYFTNKYLLCTFQ